MKKIVRIARLELSIMFYSPIAWLVLIIFIIQTGMVFTDLLYSQETSQQLGRPLNVLTKVLFAGEDGILAAVQKNLYLYIPLLTMGLFSRETSSGSIKLLFSSPVTISQIVVGKYLSMMAYAFILILVLLSFIIAGIISIEALDIPFVLGGILGIYLMACAYASIGLFMSSLTNYQVVAAISTLAVLAGLNFIGKIGQDYDFIRDITYWISISGRADNFVNGLISTKDFIYFLLVIFLFLILTIMKFNDQRNTRPAAVKMGRYSSLVVGVVVLGYISSLPFLNIYYDTTRFKDRTLTETSQDIVSRLKKPVKIKSYVNAVHYSAGYGAPKNRISDLNQFEKFRRFIPGLEMDYVFYYDTLIQYNDTTTTLLEKAKKSSTAHKFDFDELLPPEEIRKIKDLVPENNRFVRFVEYDGKTTPLRMFDDIFVYPGEAEISAALKRLIEEPAFVGILNMNRERSINKTGDDAYKTMLKGVNVRGSLINQGFDIIEIDLNHMDTIPLSVKVLIVADPKDEYTNEQKQRIKQYIDDGGNLLIAGEPGRQSFLNPILDEIGVVFKEGTLLQESEDYELDLIRADFTPEAIHYGMKFYDEAIVTLPGAMAIEIKDSSRFKNQPILITDNSSTWNALGKLDLTTHKISFNETTDNKISAPLALALTREVKDRTQKILVIGDADFMSNSELNRYNLRNVNSLFAIRLFKWFSDGEYPVNTSRPKAIDTTIKLSRTGINWMKASFFGFIPFIIGLFATVLLIRRKSN